MILEHTLHRYCAILEELMHTESITVSEIVSRLALSERTVRKDISDINQLIAPCEITRNSNLGIKLDRPSNYGWSYLFRRIMKESTRFKILERFILGKWKNSDELADQLFISNTTLKRNIRALNIDLAPLGFKLDLTKKIIIGDLNNANDLISNIYLEMYGSAVFYSCKEQRAAVNALIPYIRTGRENTSCDFHNAKLFCKIYMYLYLMRGYKEYPSIPKEHTGHKVPVELIRRINDSFQTTFDQQQLHKIICLLKEHLAKTQFGEEQLKKYAPNYSNPCILTDEIVGNIITEILKAFSISTLAKNDRLHQTIKSILICSLDSPCVLQKEKNVFLRNIENLNPYAVFKIKQLIRGQLDQSLPENPFTDDSIACLCFSLVIQMDNLYDILKKNVFSLKAALLCSYDTSHKIFLQRTIHYHMKGQLDIEFVEDQYTEDPKALSQFDLILTNYSELTVPEVPVINISSHPSVDEFGRLIETFNQLMNKKNQR
ncbi:helix-turn-helix domain-containing protein [Enterococcus raffinosus]|uniref:helix-turn-helix domain-containing protein n=1 Tax=Enterococcus raffinosus TaxID=71452 RepID=UPI001C0FDCA3|nr:helix-turn-helix domain-containing protein [Enterococcus raffinosus]MBU5359565.1 helix-turn-helix domain-containing protein [Enterococcus raffinosus]